MLSDRSLEERESCEGSAATRMDAKFGKVLSITLPPSLPPMCRVCKPGEVHAFQQLEHLQRTAKNVAVEQQRGGPQGSCRHPIA